MSAASVSMTPDCGYTFTSSYRFYKVPDPNVGGGAFNSLSVNSDGGALDEIVLLVGPYVDSHKTGPDGMKVLLIGTHVTTEAD